MGKLYEKCEHCDGTRKLIHEFRKIGAAHDEVLPVGSECICKTGYHEVGISAKQLERIIDERDKLLEFVARFAETPTDCVNDLEVEAITALEKEAKEIVKGRTGEIENFRALKRLRANQSRTSPSPKPSPKPPSA